MPVRQLRLVVTAADYDQAVHFYRDVLGLGERDAVQSPSGRVAVLDAGQATLEIAEPSTAEYIDEVEVDDVRVATAALAEAGGEVLAEPRPTPFRSTNARLNGPAGLQLTLFELA